MWNHIYIYGFPDGSQLDPWASCQAIVKQLVNQSAKGDWRAVKLLVDMLHETEGGGEPEAESSFGEADQKVIEQLKARLNGKKRESDD